MMNKEVPARRNWKKTVINMMEKHSVPTNQIKTELCEIIGRTHSHRFWFASNTTCPVKLTPRVARK
jgi:hypothetical protein